MFKIKLMVTQFMPFHRNFTLCMLLSLFCLNLCLSGCNAPTESTKPTSLSASELPREGNTPTPLAIASTQSSPSISPSFLPSISAVPAQLSTPSPSQPSPTPLPTPPVISSVQPSPSLTPPIATPTPLLESPYSCEGKEYCSQMTSCEEALFYLNNCPNPKTDGDNDGIPCESQWCGSKRN